VTLEAKLIAIGVGLVLVLGGVAAFARYERDVGARDARIATLTAANATLAARAAKIDTLYVADSVKLTHYVTRYDTARIHDTLTRDDTVFVVRSVADSAINACTITLADCRAGWTLANARADSIETLIGLVKPKPVRFWSRIGVYAGYGLTAEPGGTIVHGVELGVGIKVWP